MSEAKRVPLQTLEFPESLGHAAKKEKKKEKGQQLAPSFRFTLILPESNEETCPEFNYAQLLKSAEKKRKKERKTENATNGLDPYGEDDDEDKLRDMAKRFEAKYGTTTIGKNRSKHDDYVDLGAGYDENDSFIDNTDAYDEIVPEEVTTAHGGFYINCGALEFKTTDKNSLLSNRNNITNHDDESGESSQDTDAATKRSKKRLISTSDEDDDEDIASDHSRKKQRLDDNGDKKLNHEHNAMRKKEKTHNLPSPQDGQLDVLIRRKEKNDITDTEASEDQDEKKKSERMDSQKVKIVTDKKWDPKKIEKKPLSSSNGYDITKKDMKKLGVKDSNIDDAIESVVNAARVEDETSQETTDSGKSPGNGSESECDDDKEEAPLPDTLPEDIKDIVNKLKSHAENTKERKSKFFDSSVNEALFRLEKKLRTLNSSNIRAQTYSHLAHFLPCTRTTLLNRVKKRHLKEIEDTLKAKMQRLKTLIDSVMLSVMDKFVKDCLKCADVKGIENSLPEAGSSEDEDGSHKVEKSKIPRHKFPWSSEMKKLIYDIANARRQYFEIQRSRKESMESFVASFMETVVLKLWPPGVVKLENLIKYSNLEPVTKKKLKKPKDTNSPNNVVSSGSGNIPNPRLEVFNTTDNMHIEREQIPTIASNPVVGSSENLTNAMTMQSTIKLNELSERKHNSNKFKEKNRETFTSCQQNENSMLNMNNSAMGKITVVPTSQLMAQKPNHPDKFGIINLSSCSVSITPVNELAKLSNKSNETLKDVVSITTFQDGHIPSIRNEMSQSVQQHSSTQRQDLSHIPTLSQPKTYPMNNQTSTSANSKTSFPKHKILQQDDNEMKSERRIEDKEFEGGHKTDKKEKRRERDREREREREKDRDKDKDRDRDRDIKHKSQDSRKRKKENKTIDQMTGNTGVEIVPIMHHSSLSKEEQEQRQIDETVAATNFLSQIINDDPSPRITMDKRKDLNRVVGDDNSGNMQQTTEQDKDFQTVMKSLKELQELHSPSLPMTNIHKANKSNTQYLSYQDEYQSLYTKRDDKLRSKEETQW